MQEVNVAYLRLVKMVAIAKRTLDALSREDFTVHGNAAKNALIEIERIENEEKETHHE